MKEWISDVTRTPSQGGRESTITGEGFTAREEERDWFLYSWVVYMVNETTSEEVPDGRVFHLS